MPDVLSCWQLNLNFISMSTLLRYLIQSTKVNSLSLQQGRQSVSQLASDMRRLWSDLVPIEISLAYTGSFGKIQPSTESSTTWKWSLSVSGLHQLSNNDWTERENANGSATDSIVFVALKETIPFQSQWVLLSLPQLNLLIQLQNTNGLACEGHTENIINLKIYFDSCQVWLILAICTNKYKSRLRP